MSVMPLLSKSPTARSSGSAACWKRFPRAKTAVTITREQRDRVMGDPVRVDVDRRKIDLAVSREVDGDEATRSGRSGQVGTQVEFAVDPAHVDGNCIVEYRAERKVECPIAVEICGVGEHCGRKWAACTGIDWSESTVAVAGEYRQSSLRRDREADIAIAAERAGNDCRRPRSHHKGVFRSKFGRKQHPEIHVSRFRGRTYTIGRLRAPTVHSPGPTRTMFATDATQTVPGCAL